MITQQPSRSLRLSEPHSSKIGLTFASRLALFGGLLQTFVVLGILFLPVFQTCRPRANGEMICTGRSYLQEHPGQPSPDPGKSTGLLLFALMTAGGVLVAASAFERNRAVARLLRAAMAVLSFAVFYVTGWGLGCTFLWPSLIFLLSAILEK